MNNKFDELTKAMAQSVTRRAAFKKFGLGLAGMALACFGLANKVMANGACHKCVNGCIRDLVAEGYSKDEAHHLCPIRCFAPCWTGP